MVWETTGYWCYCFLLLFYSEGGCQLHLEGNKQLETLAVWLGGQCARIDHDLWRRRLLIRWDFHFKGF